VQQLGGGGDDLLHDVVGQDGCLQGVGIWRPADGGVSSRRPPPAEEKMSVEGGVLHPGSAKCTIAGVVGEENQSYRSRSASPAATESASCPDAG